MLPYINDVENKKTYINKRNTKSESNINYINKNNETNMHKHKSMEYLAAVDEPNKNKSSKLPFLKKNQKLKVISNNVLENCKHKEMVSKDFVEFVNLYVNYNKTSNLINGGVVPNLVEPSEMSLHQQFAHVQKSNKTYTQSFSNTKKAMDKHVCLYDSYVLMYGPIKFGDINASQYVECVDRWFENK